MYINVLLYVFYMIVFLLLMYIDILCVIFFFLYVKRIFCFYLDFGFGKVIVEC